MSDTDFEPRRDTLSTLCGDKVDVYICTDCEKDNIVSKDCQHCNGKGLIYVRSASGERVDPVWM